MVEFRSKTSASAKPKSPVHLFELLTGRSNDVKYLWAHQQAILDAYAEDHVDTKNVALELPTGSGKTLVGLLVGEYRRRALEERVAVMCPTRQLAEQVSIQAQKYGIPAVLLTGRQADYNTSDVV
jgi:replicative superfamily II helicase